MRTANEIAQELQRVKREMYAYEADGYTYLQAYAHLHGIDSGIQKGIQLLNDGYQSHHIREYAQNDSDNYQSVGDDFSDAWQMGYTAALMWCGESFDWDDEGKTVERKKEGENTMETDNGAAELTLADCMETLIEIKEHTDGAPSAKTYDLSIVGWLIDNRYAERAFNYETAQYNTLITERGRGAIDGYRAPDMLRALIDSTRALYARFGVTPTPDLARRLVLEEVGELRDESVREQLGGYQSRLLAAEAADVLVTVIGVLMAHDTLDLLPEAIARTIAKNDAKTHDTHHLVGGKITRREGGA